MTSIAECLQRAGELESVSDTPRLDLELLLARTLGRPRSYLYTWPEKALDTVEVERFEEFLKRRKGGEPVAYLLEEKEFWSLNLAVNASTLIPRPETELLVEIALSLNLDDDAEILDLGTGTGAIALALASERPHWKITATDHNPEAVALASENRCRHGLTNVELVCSDWFQKLSGRRFHLIVANPPYIDGGDPHLLQGDVRFEPRSALVAAERGLADLATIVSNGREHLLPGGWLLLEHGFDQGEALRQRFAKAGYLNIETRRDLSGRDRITMGQLRTIGSPV